MNMWYQVAACWSWQAELGKAQPWGSLDNCGPASSSQSQGSWEDKTKRRSCPDQFGEIVANRYNKVRLTWIVSCLWKDGFKVRPFLELQVSRCLKCSDEEQSCPLSDESDNSFLLDMHVAPPPFRYYSYYFTLPIQFAGAPTPCRPGHDKCNTH